MQPWPAKLQGSMSLPDAESPNREPDSLDGWAYPPRHPSKRALTQREEECARLIVLGLTNRQIAAELSLTPGTVKTYLNHIYHKVNVRNRTELAVLYAHR